MNIDTETAVAAAEVAGKLMPKTMQQIDNFGADVLKTVRLLTAPALGQIQADYANLFHGPSPF